jgi:hypothetical protein
MRISLDIPGLPANIWKSAVATPKSKESTELKRPGIIARQTAARLKGEQYAVDDGVRAARGVALNLFDLRRRKSEADQRVAAARERLESVDVFALRAELEAALAEQASIDDKLTELQGASVLMVG